MPDHQIAIQHPIFRSIAKASEDIGVCSYVVGGYVRDYLLGLEHPKDIDIVTVGSGIDLARAVAKVLPNTPEVRVFKNFGTAMVKTSEFQLEFVGARKESYDRGSRKPVVENGSLQDDQNRRDFTINAMAIALNGTSFGTLVDPFGGVEDLKAGIIRTPLDPHVTYCDDPLRMFRAVRFATRFGFEIEPRCLEAISQNKERVDILSQERIVEELHKIMATSKPSKGFLLLYNTGLLCLILPELTRLKGIEEIEGKSHKDNFYHTLEVLDNICKTTDNLWLRWTALLHDIGKAVTKRFDEKQGWTFHGHEYVGSRMVYRIFKRLKMPLNEHLQYVQKLVSMSSRPIILAQDQATDSAVRRLVFDAGKDIDDLMLLCEADITTKNPKKFKLYHNNFNLVRQKIIEVENRDRIRNFQPPVSGEEIMKTFGLKPSREIGIIKEAIKEAVLEGSIPNEYNAAFDFMVKKGLELGLKQTEA